MEENKYIKISELCKKVCSGGTPKSSVTSYYDGNIPWLNTKEINFNRIYSTERNITEEGLNNSSAKWIEKNAVVVAMYGATAGKSAISKIPLTTNQACCNLMIDPEKADYRFVYYALASDYNRLASLANGGAQQNLNAQQIKDFEIPKFTLEEQKRIADFHSSLDDKIELNRQINDNLEQQAQALFKSWFVDNINTNWAEKQLNDICLQITDGVHNSVNDTNNGGYYLLSCKNIKNGQLLISDNEREIDSITFSKLRKRTKLDKGDILLTSVGTIGEMCMLMSEPINIEFQRSVAILKPNTDLISSYFLYELLLNQQSQIKHLAHGAVQQCIFISDLKGFNITVPDKESILKFDNIVSPIFRKKAKLCDEIKSLSQLRDTLLPRLMSGELKINEINC